MVIIFRKNYYNNCDNDCNNVIIMAGDIMKNLKAELKRLKVENLDLKLQIKEQASLIEDLASKQCKVWLDMQQEFSKIRKRPI